MKMDKTKRIRYLEDRLNDVSVWRNIFVFLTIVFVFLFAMVFGLGLNEVSEFNEFKERYKDMEVEHQIGATCITNEGYKYNLIYQFNGTNEFRETFLEEIKGDEECGIFGTKFYIQKIK